ncbi:MAG: hypothetical protein GF383_06380, partial [Candidatus Lokiarchaeota archaeon]|nr:hypothetical protein [Candidatus Lokiarchaeota archaeon]MBD3339663.1 hypothetical protein [Candidatus Lokiarchaeota archaeon]
MEKNAFDLQRIRELIYPGNTLQGQLESLVDRTENYEEQVKQFEQSKYDEENASKINQISKKIIEIQNKLIEITRSNVKNFIFFQDKLLEKHKENYTRKLKQLNLSLKQTKEIGINLIENKKISKVIESANFISSISIETWLDILASLEGNSLFLSSIQKARKLYVNTLTSRFLEEMNKIPEEVSEDIKEEYKKTFFAEPQPFNEFL